MTSTKKRIRANQKRRRQDARRAFFSRAAEVVGYALLIPAAAGLGFILGQGAAGF